MYRKTWKEKIIEVMTPKPPSTTPLWFSHSQIARGLNLTKCKDGYKFTSINSYVKKLVRSGHIERAWAPPGAPPLSKYVYRLTGKPFTPFNGLGYNTDPVQAVKGDILYRRYPRVIHSIRRLMM